MTFIRSEFSDITSPTVSVPASGYAGHDQTITLTDWSNYSKPTVWCCIRDSGGSIVTDNKNVTDNGDGTLTVPTPATPGTYTVQVKVREFGTKPSKAVESSIVLTTLPSYRYWRLANWDGNTPGVKDWRLYTGSGPGAGTQEHYSSMVDGDHGTRYPTQRMTGGSSPSPYVATHSYAYSTSYEGWKAFDSNSSSQWWALGHNQPAAAADWVQIDLGAAVGIQSSWISTNNAQGLTIQASNDGVTWTDLGTTTITGTGYNGTWVL